MWYMRPASNCGFVCLSNNNVEIKIFVRFNVSGAAFKETPAALQLRDMFAMISDRACNSVFTLGY
jgi:hypothetical protein